MPNPQPPQPPTVTLTCDMEEGCTTTVTHLDVKGYVYCHAHGQARKAVQRCRKLTPAERKQLERGEPLERY